MRSPDPVFIVGAQRSGTTLLRVALTSHPSICIPPENAFYKLLANRWQDNPNLGDESVVDEFLNDLFAVRRFDAWELNKDSLRAELLRRATCDYSTAIQLIVEQYVKREKPNASCWGIKNPNGVLHIDLIKQLFPNAQIVHILRDARAVYGSEKKKRMEAGAFHKNYQIWRCCRLWRQAWFAAEDFRDDHQVYLVRYEDFVRNLEPELKKLLEWLDIAWSDDVLNYHNKNTDQQLVPENRRWQQSLTFKPPDPERIDAWQSELDRSEINAIELLLGRKLNRSGYTQLTGIGKYTAVPTVAMAGVAQLYRRFFDRE